MTKKNVFLAVGATALVGALAPLSTAHAATSAPAKVTAVPTTTHAAWVGVDPVQGSPTTSGSQCSFDACTGSGTGTSGSFEAFATVTVVTPNVAWGPPPSLVEVRLVPGRATNAGGPPATTPPTTATLKASGATIMPVVGQTVTWHQAYNANDTSQQYALTVARTRPAADGVTSVTGYVQTSLQPTVDSQVTLDEAFYEVTPAAGHSASVTVNVAYNGHTGATHAITIPAADAATPQGDTLTVTPALASAEGVGVSLFVAADNGTLTPAEAAQIVAANGVSGSVAWTGTGGATFTPGASALSVSGTVAPWTDPQVGQSVTAAGTLNVPTAAQQAPYVFTMQSAGHLSVMQDPMLAATISTAPSSGSGITSCPPPPSCPPPTTIIKTVTVPGPTRTVTVTVPGPTVTRTVTVPGPTRTVTVPGPTRTVVHTMTKVETQTMALSLAADAAPLSGRWVPVTVRLDASRGAAWQLVQLAAKGPRGTRVAHAVLTAHRGVALGRVWVPADATAVAVTASDGLAAATLTLHPHTDSAAPWPWWWVVLAAVGLTGAAGWTQSVWKRRRHTGTASPQAE